KLDEIKEHGGVDRLLGSFSTHLKGSEDGDIVGVIIDADVDIHARWQSLRNTLIHLGYQNVTDNPSPDGSIFDSPTGTLLPRVGIWMMPDNQNQGILEDFLRFLIPTGSRLFDHVSSSVAAIPQGERRFSAFAEPKALIHTWLAWQAEPGKPLGTSITARYLDPDVAQVDILVSWLDRLFFL
ncbi:MAG: hypothetical protein DWI57_18175, partial [Chloroflexi bacterium]